MSYNMEWVFDGIGTTIIGAILGLIVGGVSGYRIGVKKVSIKQKQTARDMANQVQIGIKHGSE